MNRPAGATAPRGTFCIPRPTRLLRRSPEDDAHVKYFLAVKFTPSFFFTFFGPYLSPGHAKSSVINGSSVIDPRTKKFSDPTTLP
ncbi:MAG: hypothetical protein IPK99_00670 [Flavobacteriales bacterium]|nr:hypothetical protein [Flavobacteriales bacterium]